MQDTIGIDVSKGTLDLHRRADGANVQLGNDTLGFKRLLKWTGPSAAALIVFEATGAYHRSLEKFLNLHRLPYVKVNPKQARRFAQAVGKLAKTDRVDAEMLARMGSALDLQAKEQPHESLHELKELLTARRALIKDQTAAKSRLATATVPLLRRQIKRRLAQIARDIAQLDIGMREQADKDEAIAERMDILASIPGVGRLTAITMLVDMPELGTLEAKQVAALAGLAPITQQSGKWQGTARIQGGRPWIRRALYMPALVAVRFNPDLKAKYTQFIDAGKPPKLALTAIMRKLLVMANTLLRDHRMWSEVRP